MPKDVEHVRFSTEYHCDREMLRRLNVLARVLHRTVNDTARFLLMEITEEKIREYGINMSDFQPTVG